MGPVRDLGPCALIWDPSGVNLNLGATFGGCTFKSEENIEPIFVDGQGNVPIDHVTMGRICSFEAPLTQPILSTLQAVIKDSVLVGTELKIYNSVGETYFAVSKELIAKPLLDNVPTADSKEWLHIFRCYPIHNFEIGYDRSGQKIYRVTFNGYPDDTSGNVGALWKIGS